MDKNLYTVATAIVLLWILVVACFAEPVRWTKRPSIRVRKRQANRNTMCADPGTPDNGFRIGAVFYRGYSVRFGCNPGYRLAGARILNCTTDSTHGVQWDAMTPQCTRTFRMLPGLLPGPYKFMIISITFSNGYSYSLVLLFI